MTASLERAAARLNALQTRMPDVVLLARVSSLAVRIEPHLLRRLRFELLPEVDVGSESDLWFSSLVESRGATGVVLQQPVAILLRDNLATDKVLLTRAANITSEAHAHLSPVLRLEETVTALALLDREAAVQRIDDAFKPVLRALKEDDERGLEMARWMLRAAPRFPAVVWQASAAYSLLHASSVLLGGRRILEEVPDAASLDPQTIAWALPASVREERVEIGIELLPAALQFSAADDAGARIRVPPTTPPVVEVRWLRDSTPVRVLIDPIPGRVVDLGPDVASVTLRTVAGDVYRVEREAAPRPSFTHDVFISYARQDAERATQIAAALSRAGLSVFIDQEQVLAGERFEQEIERAIRGSRVMLVLWSESAAASEFTRREVALALEREVAAGAVIPVLFERAPLPPELSHLHALDMTGWTRSGSDRELQPLLEAVHRLLEVSGAATRGWKPERARILEPDGMEEACVRVRDDRGRYATGFHLAPQIVATAAEPFAGSISDGRSLVVERGEYEEDGRVLNAGDGAPVLMLQTGLVNTEPLQLVTDVTRRPRANQLTVPSRARVIVAFADGTRSVEAEAHVLHDKSDSFEITVPERNLPQEFFGAPVVIGNGAAGIVTALQTGVFPQSTLRVTGAIVLQSLVSATRRREAPVGEFTQRSTLESPPARPDSFVSASSPPPRPWSGRVEDSRGSGTDQSYETPEFREETPSGNAPSAEKSRGFGQRLRDVFSGLLGGRRRGEPAAGPRRREPPSDAPQS